MNIKNSAGFGVGYKIKTSEYPRSDYSNFGEYITKILENFPNGISLFGVSSGLYGKNDCNWYLIADNPFEIGLDLTHIKVCLDDIIDSSNLERDSEFGVIEDYVYSDEFKCYVHKNAIII